MTSLAARTHQCVTCRALPVRPFDPGDVDPAQEYRPGKPRPVVAGGPRSRVCATHDRAKRKARKAAAHASRVRKVYGLEQGDYDRLLALQGGTCAIPRCPASGKRKRLAVDHDHETGEVRGLLCGPHNYELLGKYAGDLRDALDYLADPPARRLRTQETAA